MTNRYEIIDKIVEKLRLLTLQGQTLTVVKENTEEPGMSQLPLVNVVFEDGRQVWERQSGQTYYVKAPISLEIYVDSSSTETVSLIEQINSVILSTVQSCQDDEEFRDLVNNDNWLTPNSTVATNNRQSANSSAYAHGVIEMDIEYSTEIE